MRPSTALALLALPLLSCSVEVDQPTSKTTASQYELIVVEGEASEPVHYLLDTRTGALHVREGQRWREVVGPVGD